MIPATNFANQIEEGNMFYACHLASVFKDNTIWYVDSAYSNHMTSYESLLIDVNKNVSAKVKIGTGDLVQAAGKGNLVIETNNGKRYIKEVMIVPSLDENLLNVGQMVEHGHFLLFGDYTVDIFLRHEP